MSLKGPKFDPKYHALPSTTTSKACNYSFRTFFHLKKHVEASNCPHRERLWQLADDYHPDEEAPAAADRPSIIAQVASDPGDAALNPEFREQLRERCCLCSQKLAMKGVKQHLNKQHAATMGRVWAEIEPKLDTFEVMVKKGHQCRFCGIQVDAPGRHVRQCVPLLQAHVVQSTHEHGLNKVPESSKAKQTTKQSIITGSTTLPTFTPHSTDLLSQAQQFGKSLLCQFRPSVPLVAAASVKARGPLQRAVQQGNANNHQSSAFLLQSGHCSLGFRWDAKRCVGVSSGASPFAGNRYSWKMGVKISAWGKINWGRCGVAPIPLIQTSVAVIAGFLESGDHASKCQRPSMHCPFCFRCSVAALSLSKRSIRVSTVWSKVQT